MACLLTSGYTNGCRDNTGGVQLVYIRNYSAGTTYTYNSSNQITGGTNTSSTFYKFEQRPEVAEFKQDGQHSIENGTNFWQQDATLSLVKYQASVRNLLYTLAQTEMEVIVLDQNGSYWLMGEQNGANLISSTASVGKGYGDMNGATLGLQAKEPQPARELTSTFFSTLTVA